MGSSPGAGILRGHAATPPLAIRDFRECDRARRATQDSRTGYAAPRFSASKAIFTAEVRVLGCGRPAGRPRVTGTGAQGRASNHLGQLDDGARLLQRLLDLFGLVLGHRFLHLGGVRNVHKLG